MLNLLEQVGSRSGGPSSSAHKEGGEKCAIAIKAIAQDRVKISSDSSWLVN